MKNLVKIRLIACLMLGLNCSAKDYTIPQNDVDVVVKKQKEKEAKCIKYLDNADDILSKIESNNYGVDATRSNALLSTAYMQRYEICMKEALKNM